MFDMVEKARWGIKKFMNEKINTCKEILSSAQNRLILGILILTTGIGVGGGLIISAYVSVPKKQI